MTKAAGRTHEATLGQMELQEVTPTELVGVFAVATGTVFHGTKSTIRMFTPRDARRKTSSINTIALGIIFGTGGKAKNPIVIATTLLPYQEPNATRFVNYWLQWTNILRVGDRGVMTRIPHAPPRNFTGRNMDLAEQTGLVLMMCVMTKLVDVETLI